MRLLLFDIDGTLLRCGRQVRDIFAEALLEVFGTTGAIDAYDFGGKTDPQIVRDLMVGAGLSHQEVDSSLPRMREAYLPRLEQRLQVVEVLPGVRETLAAVRSRPGIAVGLLTGNWRRGAQAKLGRAGLDGFAFGAFGDDGEDRACLPPVALERARQATGRLFAPAEALIIGDSLEDVRCARACGVPVLAVASGWTPAERLREAGADRVVATLEEGLPWMLPVAVAAGGAVAEPGR
jgi:phosphoglycolate phosphatase-like HAD superfamily hydrolase